MPRVLRSNTKRSAVEEGQPGAEKGRQKRSKKASNEDSSLLEMGNFISPLVVQYLGTRSLVRFGSAIKSHGTVVSNEVVRRKERIAAIETQVAALLGAPEDVPLRDNVLRASDLAQEAKTLIDDEVNLHDTICNSAIDEIDCDHDKLFANERKMFLADIFEGAGSLYILPLCFYLPPTGESTHPPKKQVSAAYRKAEWLWNAEDTMQGVYECDWSIHFYDYEDPFRKFRHLLADFYTNECMHETADELVFADALDAFRIAARKVFFRAPASRDCLWYTLEAADEIAAELEEEGEE